MNGLKFPNNRKRFRYNRCEEIWYSQVEMEGGIFMKQRHQQLLQITISSRMDEQRASDPFGVSVFRNGSIDIEHINQEAPHHPFKQNRQKGTIS